MDYYGLLFLYYLKGLSGKSILRLFFNIEVGGTEQLLPENTSTPTTSPILADIQYPDGLRTDQYFTYRETPTTVSNKARIKTIKGNTLNWNQLVENGNFADTSVWNTTSGVSFTVSGNVANVTSTDSYGRIRQFINFISGHKYLIFADVKKSNADDSIRLYYGTQLGGGSYIFENNTNWQKLAIIKTATSSESSEYPNVEPITDNITWQQRNMMVIDLTKMGLDSLTVNEFTSLFPLPYYAYNQGTLLSFMGNGIKTVGFNQWDEEWEAGALSVADGSTINVNSYLRSKNFIPVISGKTYCRGISYQSDCRVFYYDANHSYIGNVATSSANTLFTIPSGVSFIKFHKNGANYDNNICINISSDRNGTYEPYTSSTLSLPISTYFPDGMNRAGRAYDELGESKATKRTKIINLGSINKSSILKYENLGEGVNFYRINQTPFEDRAFGDNSSGIKGLCSKYEWYGNTVTSGFANVPNKSFGFQSTVPWIFIRDDSYTTIDDFYDSLQDVYLCYELATPTETPITTEDANEALSLLMGKSVSSNDAKQMIDIITKGE